jgi:hypothetical protein
VCVSCVTSADAAITGGILGVASLRVGLRQLLPNPPRWARRVSDDEARAFVASLAPGDAPTGRQDATPPAVDGDRTHAHA